MYVTLLYQSVSWLMKRDEKYRNTLRNSFISVQADFELPLKALWNTVYKPLFKLKLFLWFS